MPDVLYSNQELKKYENIDLPLQVSKGKTNFGDPI